MDEFCKKMYLKMSFLRRFTWVTR